MKVSSALTVSVVAIVLLMGSFSAYGQKLYSDPETMMEVFLGKNSAAEDELVSDMKSLLDDPTEYHDLLSRIRTTQLSWLSRRARTWYADLAEYGWRFARIAVAYYDSNGTLKGFQLTSEYRNWASAAIKHINELAEEPLKSEITRLSQEIPLNFNFLNTD